MGTVAPTNVTLTKDGRTVTIGVTSVEQTWTKSLIFVNIPKTTKEQDIDEGENTTKIVDLLMKSQRRWNVNGEIATGLGDGDTKTYVNEKRDELREIFFAGQSEEGGQPTLTTMTYEGGTAQVNFDKMSVKWVATKDDQDPKDSYSVTFTAIEGTPL